MEKLITPRNLRSLIEDYVISYPNKTGEKNIWRRPLIAIAKVDNRFNILHTIASKDHLLPQDLMPSAKSVIVFFIPFVKELAIENHKSEIPCLNWGLAYESTNRLITSLCEYIQHCFEKDGYKAELTPATHNFDHLKLVSRWSHKHLGYLAGLGTFGINAQLITPSGCAGRLGSLVTDVEFGDNRLVTDEELCLHKKGYKCLKCIKRCPVDAVAESGINRKLCWERLKSNLSQEKEFKCLENTTHTCAKCQVFLPCSLKSPKKKLITDLNVK